MAASAASRQKLVPFSTFSSELWGGRKSRGEAGGGRGSRDQLRDHY